MGIIRIVKDKNNPYVMLNKTCIQDTELSWKAKGLHSYVMSLPDDWEIYLKDLANRSKDGRDSTSAALKELEEKRYLSRLPKRDIEGKLQGGYDYTFYESPITEKPKSEKPKSEKPTLLINNITNKPSILNNNITNNQEAVKSVSRYVEQTLGIIGPNNMIELLSYLDDDVEADLIIRAIDEAVGNGKRTYSYVRGILNNWLKSGIKKSAQLTEHKNKKHDTKSIHDKTNKYKGFGGIDNGKCSSNNANKFGKFDNDGGNQEKSSNFAGKTTDTIDFSDF